MLSAGAVVVAATLAAGLQLAHLHRRTTADAERELTNLALVLSHYTENTFRSVELLQNGLVEMIEAMNLQGVEQFNELLSTYAMNREMRTRVLGLPQVEAVFLTNANGQTIASTRAWPQPVFSIVNRPHFKVLHDNPSLDSYLAPPAQNYQTGTWNIYLSRRLRAADGSFLGIVGVGLSLAQFENFLSRISIGQESSISVWRRDGTLMARHPSAIQDIGRVRPGMVSAFQEVLAQRDSGTVTALSPQDDRERLIAVRATADYPVVVTVARTATEVLSLWWRLTAYTIGGVVLLLAVSIAAIVLGVRHLRNHEMLEQARTDLRLVEEQRRSEAQLTHLAHHDPLTGLANRTLLRKSLDDAVAHARRGEACAVLCLDLDHFKDVNDTLGHPIGDLLLQAVTGRIKAEVREVDTIARLGGDEFAVVLTGMRQPQDAAGLAQRLVDTLGAPFDLDGHHILVGASIGIAAVSADVLDPDQLLQNADMALYRAKANGRGGYSFFESEMNLHAQLRRTLQLDLRRALDAGEFELFYQPQVNIRTRRVGSLEALLRWRHPENGLVAPDRIIPMVEEIGLIVPLGEWVLKQACAAAVDWPGGEKVSVNLSPVQFASARLVSVVTSALQSSGLDASRLELEITESVLMRDTEATLATLHRLKQLGVSIALDDFGTGYSSLSYLQRFPFDKVKIDKSFISSLGRTVASAAIVRAVTDLCIALGMSTTAEGVETEEQYAALSVLGCTDVQGYLFSRPCPIAEVPAILRRLNGAAADAAQPERQDSLART
jgi:diguanylate cyclase (GGDEF)-like protein